METETLLTPPEALLELHGLLDGLLLPLESAEDAARQPAAIGEMLGKALTQASTAKLRGVVELLRMWVAAISQRNPAAGPMDATDAAFLHAWVSDLLSFCVASLDREGQQRMVGSLASVPALSTFSPRVLDYIVARLGETESVVSDLLMAAMESITRRRRRMHARPLGKSWAFADDCDVALSEPVRGELVQADLHASAHHPTALFADADEAALGSPTALLESHWGQTAATAVEGPPPRDDAAASLQIPENTLLAVTQPAAAELAAFALSDTELAEAALAVAVRAEVELAEAALAEAALAEAALAEVELAEVELAEAALAEAALAEVDLAGAALAEAALAEVELAEAALAEAALAEVELAEAALAEAALAEVELAEAALAEAALAEVDLLEAELVRTPSAHAVDPSIDSDSDPLDGLDGYIWISNEELQLSIDAVGEQIMPSICALADSVDADEQAVLLADLEFTLGLVGNAMEMLGTPALSHGISTVQAAVAAGSLTAADVLLNWCTALVGYLEHPDLDSAELLGMFAAEIPGLDANWNDRLALEAIRIRVGNDPALLAARKTTVEPEDIVLQAADDVLPNVLEGMLRELPINAERLGSAVRRLVVSGDVSVIDEARRVAHTLKGDANTVGIRGLANITHSLEDLLIELHKLPQRLVPELASVLDRAADCVEEIADFLLGRGDEPSAVAAVYQSLLDWSLRFATDEPLAAEIQDRRSGQRTEAVAALAPTAVAEPTKNPSVDMPAALAKVGEPIEAGSTSSARTATLTVSADLLDELQRLAGETLVMARQIDQRLNMMNAMHREQIAEGRLADSLLGKLDDLVSLRGAALQSTALRGGDAADPLELDQYNELHVVSRQLLETSADNHDHHLRVDVVLSELEDLRSQQEAVNADLRRAVQRARTVPFDQLAGRLQRIVRQTARDVGRQVELHLEGEKTQLDAELLDRVIEPLAHLLRNAIDHGLEDGDERLARGKPQQGTIAITVATVGDSIEIQIADDGRGLDFQAIHSKAIGLGIVKQDQVLSEAELVRLILAPGFTTRSHATQVSGRGIGMDVVNQRVIDLRGQLLLKSVFGQGLKVTLRLPLSQTQANVIVAHGHGVIIAAVAGSVERVQHFSANELSYADDGQVRILVDGEHIPVVPLETLYDLNSGKLKYAERERLGLVVRSASGKRVVVSVTSVSEVSNVIVKPISPHLPPVPSIRGMTVLGDGRLVVVADMESLLDLQSAESSNWNLTHLSNQLVKLPQVVVADDSLSVRRAMAQLMEDAGFEVAVARDGLEALELINTHTPDLVLIDLEMPKLNGLEVTRAMRARIQTRAIPVLMITSRASDKYRTQAQAAGVTMMLGKPVSEDELISSVRTLMSRDTTIHAMDSA